MEDEIVEERDASIPGGEIRREQEEAEVQGLSKKKIILTTDAAMKSAARAYKKEAENKVKESGERSLFDEDTEREKKKR